MKPHFVGASNDPTVICQTFCVINKARVVSSYQVTARSVHAETLPLSSKTETSSLLPSPDAITNYRICVILHVKCLTQSLRGYIFAIITFNLLITLKVEITGIMYVNCRGRGNGE